MMIKIKRVLLMMFYRGGISLCFLLVYKEEHVDNLKCCNSKQEPQTSLTLRIHRRWSSCSIRQDNISHRTKLHVFTLATRILRMHAHQYQTYQEEADTQASIKEHKPRNIPTSADQSDNISNNNSNKFVAIIR